MPRGRGFPRFPYLFPVARIADGRAFGGARIDALIVDGDVALIAPEIKTLLAVAGVGRHGRRSVRKRCSNEANSRKYRAPTHAL
jgi:hypothetical protein